MEFLDTLSQKMKIGEFEVLGFSRAGQGTSFVFPLLDICFDVAQGLPFHLNVKKYFITHGHLDHAAGLPYIASQKALNKSAPPEFFLPTSMIDPIHEIFKLWSKIEDFTIPYTIYPVTAHDQFELKPPYFIRPFKTVHRIESFGYSLFRKNKKLKAIYRGLTGIEIVGLKKQGVEVDEVKEEPLISFTGDTQIEVLSECSWLKNCRYLFIECTYLDDRKNVEHAKKWGHLHIDELIPLLDELNCEKIILIHFSRRYRAQEIPYLLLKKLPKKEQGRVVAFI